VVDLAQRALLGAHRTGEVAEVVDGQRDVRRQRLAYGLAVLPALRDRERLQVGLHAVGDLQQDVGPLGCRPAPPAGRRRVGRVQGRLDVLRRAARHLGERLPVHRTRILEVLTPDRRHVLPADVVVVTGLVGDDRALAPGRRVSGHAEQASLSSAARRWAAPRRSVGRRTLHPRYVTTSPRPPSPEGDAPGQVPRTGPLTCPRAARGPPGVPTPPPARPDVPDEPPWAGPPPAPATRPGRPRPTTRGPSRPAGRDPSGRSAPPAGRPRAVA